VRDENGSPSGFQASAAPRAWSAANPHLGVPPPKRNDFVPTPVKVVCDQGADIDIAVASSIAALPPASAPPSPPAVPLAGRAAQALAGLGMVVRRHT
jgi:hypothetical protein